MTLRIAQYYPRALSGDGGMTRAIQRISYTWQRLDIPTTIICETGPEPEPESEAVRWRRIRHRHLRGRSVPDPGELRAALRDSDVVILNSAWTLHNVVAASVARRMGVAYVLAPRGAYDPRIRARHRLAKDAWWLAAERRLVARSLAVHVFFEAERDHLRRLGHAGPIIVAPNGVDVPDGPIWDGGSDGVVLWLGRFDPEHKGLDLLLHALQELPPGNRPRLSLRGPDWHHRKATVLALAERLGLANWVTVAGPVYGSEKLALIARARAFVYPSRWEGFGNSLAEAASLGVPLLATPYPLGRLLASRGAAVLAEPTAAGLAAGLSTVLGPGAAAMGARARTVIAADFGWDTVAQAWIDGLERALAARRR